MWIFPVYPPKSLGNISIACCIVLNGFPDVPSPIVSDPVVATYKFTSVLSVPITAPEDFTMIPPLSVPYNLVAIKLLTVQVIRPFL